MKKEEIENHVMVKYGQQFNELCKPLLVNTPINYVGLAKLYNNGSRSYLITDPEWGKVLLKNRYHLAGTEDALVNSPEISHQLWTVSSMFTLNPQTQKLFQDCVANNYGNGITLIERAEDSIEFFHICANSGYEQADPFLAHNIDRLWNYILYIREFLANDKELKNAYNKKYYYDIKLNENTSQLESLSPQFKTKRYYLGGNFGEIYFTKKEMHCLILLYKNRTLKGIAHELNLSAKTIEHYINNIKKKINCSTSREIVWKLSSNNLFKSITSVMI